MFSRLREDDHDLFNTFQSLNRLRGRCRGPPQPSGGWFSGPVPVDSYYVQQDITDNSKSSNKETSTFVSQYIKPARQ